MRFGCCAGAESAGQLAAAGFDYIELALAPIAALPQAEFDALAGRLAGAQINVEAFNIFFPGTLRLTGDNADLAAAETYAAGAFARVARLGGKTIVFGSGGARRVPEGFPMDKAFGQLVEMLRRIAPLAAQHGITIAIEPLNRGECNIINSVAEGLALTRAVDRPAIRLLADYYHMAVEHEAPAILLEAAPYLQHVHFAKPEDRSFPAAVEEAWLPFYAHLKAAKYDLRLSIEGRTSDLAADATRALPVLRQLCA